MPRRTRWAALAYAVAAVAALCVAVISAERASGIGSSTTSKKSGAVTNGKGSEVTKQPEESAKDGLPGLGKLASAKNRSLVSKPLPKTASSRGKIVAGFPLKVVPLVSDSDVQTSGVSSTGTTLQVSVQATNSRSPEKILAFYRKSLTAQGFSESAVPSAGAATAARDNSSSPTPTTGPSSSLTASDATPTAKTRTSIAPPATTNGDTPNEAKPSEHRTSTSPTSRKHLGTVGPRHRVLPVEIASQHTGR